MRLIIAGSRDISWEEAYAKIVELRIEDHEILFATEIVSGCCPTGADHAGEIYGEFYSIPVTLFKPDWETHGRAAGPIRNKQMAEYGDALLLIWDGESRGSRNMKYNMKELNKPVYEVIM